jgi:VWFA-related protein
LIALAALAATSMSTKTIAVESLQERVPQAVFGARVEVVQIQVQVEDDDGNFVSGLTPEDFYLRVDGNDREVALVYEVDLSGERDVDLQPDPTLPPAGWRQFLLFFDLSFTTPRGLMEARDAAYGFVQDNVHPNDLVGVATFNLVSGMQVLCPFTIDRAQALDAVSTMGLNRAMSITDPAGFAFAPAFEEIDTLIDLTTATGETPDGAAGAGLGVDLPDVLRSTLVDAARSDFRRYREEVSQYIAQLELMGETLKAMRGRKHVVMFSSGFDDHVLTGQSLEEFAEDSEKIQSGRLWEVDAEKRFGSSDLRTSLQEALESLRQSDAVIHAVDTSMLVAGGEVRGGTYQSGTSGRNALNYLSSGTSGTVSWNYNDLSIALDNVEESTQAFYVIAYPLDPADPEVVDLEVRVGVEDVEVTSAPQRFAPPPQYADLDATQQQLQLAEVISKGLEPDTYSFEIEATPFIGEGDISRVAVIVEIPWHQLLSFASPRDDGQVEIEILGYTLDEAGAMLDFFNRRVDLDLQRLGSMDPENGVPFRYYDLLWAIPGEYRVRVLLREATVGNLGTQTVSVSVPEFSGDHLAVSGPVFIDAKRPGLVMRGVDPASPPERKAHGPVAYPFTLGGRELTPFVWPSVAPGESCQFYAVVYHLARDMISDQVQATVNADAVDARGNAVSLGQLQVIDESYDSASDATALLLEVSLPAGFARGAYDLRLTVADGIAGVETIGAAPFFVSASDN